MDNRAFFVWICFFFICSALTTESGPEQVHISFGDNHNSMVVMWSSRDNIQYNLTYWSSRARGVDCVRSDVMHLPKQVKKAAPYVHRAVLKNLTEGTQYFYQIKPNNESRMHFESELFSFSTLKKSQDTPYKFLVYGDLGSHGDLPTYAMLKRLVDTGNYTAIWHVGDMAYDLNMDFGAVGDTFFKNIQPFASKIPYMTAPGNHENDDDSIHYRTRLSTPNTPWPIPKDRMWYSYNVGPVHFISYSTEVFFTDNQYYVCQQFDWLLKDLITANRNRNKQPWIIALGHRPMYCSNDNIDDCTNRFTGRWVKYGLEDLFYAQGVDLIIQAHEHSYERLWPVYQGEVQSRDYNNPSAPVHVITGAAGGREGLNKMTPGLHYEWSAFKASRDSWSTIGQLEIHNSTHLYFQQRESVIDETLDGFWLVQNNHGPFVSNLVCEGGKPHYSCLCPAPIPYVIYIVAAIVVFSSALFILVCVIVVYICKKRRLALSYVNRGLRYTQLHEEKEVESLIEEKPR